MIIAYLPSHRAPHETFGIILQEAREGQIRATNVVDMLWLASQIYDARARASTVATVLLQQSCCNRIVPTVLLQQYCCNCTACTVLYILT